MREWLTSNRVGSFAMGTPERIPDRKYHGAFILRQAGAASPLHILADVAECVVTPLHRHELSCFRYGDVVHPQGHTLLRSFSARPHPTWEYACQGIRVRRELRLVPDRDEVEFRYRVRGAPPGTVLHLAPLFTARDVHALTHENPYLDGRAQATEQAWRFEFYRGFPAIELSVEPLAPLTLAGFWNRGVVYAEEARRGYAAKEDLYCPGVVKVPVCGAELRCTLRVRVPARAPASGGAALGTHAPGSLEAGRSPRHAGPLAERLWEAADRYLYLEPATRAPGIIAGYPWFADWSRDTLISLPGLLLARDRFDEAQRLLDRVVGLRVEGVVPRLLCSTATDNPEPCADATLWFARAVQLLETATDAETARPYWAPLLEMLEALHAGTIRGLRGTEDGLLLVDRRPRASTWMDAEVDGQAVTPRAPLAIEIQALHVQAVRYGLRCAARLGRPAWVERWQPRAERQREALRRCFWNPHTGHLNDAHDGQRPDPALRPNQVIALALDARGFLNPSEQRSALAHVRRQLWTPCGLRTLAPSHPEYLGHCVGIQLDRDRAYHQGTVWPWLLGHYFDAVTAIEGPAVAAREFAQGADELLRRLDDGCQDQLAEIFDGDAPHAARGAPAQAWSVAELLRAALQHGGAGCGHKITSQSTTPVRCES